jgi:hypothetical protein
MGLYNDAILFFFLIHRAQQIEKFDQISFFFLFQSNWWLFMLLFIFGYPHKKERKRLLEENQKNI